MSILKIDHPPTVEELVKLTEFFPDYIKIVVDLDQKILYGGSEFHADIENFLLENGSIQSAIWGGGVNTQSKKVDCLAIINIRSGINPDPNILNQKIREQFLNVVKSYFPDYTYG